VREREGEREREREGERVERTSSNEFKRVQRLDFDSRKFIKNIQKKN
jgi:hypothetical protein